MDQYQGSPDHTGCKPKQNLISFGNETLDKFLGGGFLNSSLNIFERQGPCSRPLDPIWNKSLASSTLSSKDNLIYINFNTLQQVDDGDKFLLTLPLQRKVKSDTLYKDIQEKSAAAKIKIAWRYTNRSAMPRNSAVLMDQIDFALPISKSDLGRYKIINVEKNFSLKDLISAIERSISELVGSQKAVNIIVGDLLHPFSPIVDNTKVLCSFIYTMRSLARSIDRGAILVSYDANMCKEYQNIKQYLYNLADSVVSFYSYETGQNKLTGYKYTDGTVDYLKVPKINTYGLHYQRELSDWGYRLTKNSRYFMIDELSLPPCHDDQKEDKIKKQSASELTNIEHKRGPLKQVGPLEDFKEVAKDVLAKQL